jgi:hypothetical protein
MEPALALNDSTYFLSADSEPTRKHHTTVFSGDIQRFDLPCFFGSNFSVSRLKAAPFLSIHVNHIVAKCTQKEMGGVDAIPNIAAVKHKEPWWYSAMIGFFPSNAMSPEELSFAHYPDVSVPRVRVGSNDPTSGFADFVFDLPSSS